eukprot:maker-scaffold272_size230267-snap-gene-1.11 protein:Tk00259 transcript:maker-scaffold272_size230267-snap-gene-1.11-mRNA-1 annotation:"protein pet100 mitochondrial-like"
MKALGRLLESAISSSKSSPTPKLGQREEGAQAAFDALVMRLRMGRRRHDRRGMEFNVHTCMQVHLGFVHISSVFGCLTKKVKYSHKEKNGRIELLERNALDAVGADTSRIGNIRVEIQLNNMGNWQLEVGRMVLYVFTPVSAFYMFHQIDLFENFIKEFQRKERNHLALKDEDDYKRFTSILKTDNTTAEADFRQQLLELEAKAPNVPYTNVVTK